MGEVRVEVVVANPHTGAQSEPVTALADTGATLAVLPGPILDRLSIQRLRKVGLILTNGRRTERDIGDATITLNEESVPCRVVFGEPDDASLVGLTVLEQLGLAVDPVGRRLVPADFLLY
jgi:predicted aspartyl protease